MPHDKIGPKEMMLRQLAADKRAERSKPTPDELRAKIAAVPPESQKRAAKKAAKKKEKG